MKLKIALLLLAAGLSPVFLSAPSFGQIGVNPRGDEHGTLRTIGAPTDSLCAVDTVGKIDADVTSGNLRVCGVDLLWHTASASAGAPTDSPTFTGVATFTSSPIVPTPLSTDNSSKAATTSFVQAHGFKTPTGTGFVHVTLGNLDAATTVIALPTNGGTGTDIAPSAGQLLVGQSSGAYIPFTVRGDVSLGSNGVATVLGLNGSAIPHSVPQIELNENGQLEESTLVKGILLTVAVGAASTSAFLEGVTTNSICATGQILAHSDNVDDLPNPPFLIQVSTFSNTVGVNLVSAADGKTPVTLTIAQPINVVCFN